MLRLHFVVTHPGLHSLVPLGNAVKDINMYVTGLWVPLVAALGHQCSLVVRRHWWRRRHQWHPFPRILAHKSFMALPVGAPRSLAATAPFASVDGNSPQSPLRLAANFGVLTVRARWLTT